MRSSRWARARGRATCRRRSSAERRVAMSADLAGKAIVVTGAGSGIGRAISARLVDAGADVLAVDLRPDPSAPGVPCAADLGTREGNRHAIETALDRFGRLDAV